MTKCPFNNFKPCFKEECQAWKSYKYESIDENIPPLIGGECLFVKERIVGPLLSGLFSRNMFGTAKQEDD